MKNLFCILGGIVAFCITGCATIVCPTEYPVTISTNAPDAKVIIRKSNNGTVITSGKAPLIVTLKTNKGFFDPMSYQCEVIDKKDKKQTRVIETKFNKWFIGNFILGGIIGMGIDGISGACYKFDEEFYVHFSEHEK